MFENIAAPGTPQYDLMLKIIFAWYYYFVPIVPLYDKLEPYEYMKMAMDPNWLFQCAYSTYLVLIYELEIIPWGYGNGPYSWLTKYLAWGLVVPLGVVPPLVQAIVNGSLWTRYPQYAAYLGLPTPNPAIQHVLLHTSIFHTLQSPPQL